MGSVFDGETSLCSIGSPNVALSLRLSRPRGLELLKLFWEFGVSSEVLRAGAGGYEKVYGIIRFVLVFLVLWIFGLGA